MRHRGGIILDGEYGERPNFALQVPIHRRRLRPSVAPRNGLKGGVVRVVNCLIVVVGNPVRDKAGSLGSLQNSERVRVAPLNAPAFSPPHLVDGRVERPSEALLRGNEPRHERLAGQQRQFLHVDRVFDFVGVVLEVLFGVFGDAETLDPHRLLLVVVGAHRLVAHRLVLVVLFRTIVVVVVADSKGGVVVAHDDRPSSLRFCAQWCIVVVGS